MSFTYDERIDGPLATVGRDTLVAALHASAPGLDVLHEREALKPFECDGLAAYRTVPLAARSPAMQSSSVVLPAPFGPASASRSRRSTLNETPSKSGSPDSSFRSADAIRTATP